jgi:regulator of protease activity HflC (stomatin/prohibitin superfamily)
MTVVQAIGVNLIWIILAIIILIVLAKNIIIVQQSKAYVIERLGAFHTVWGVGIHFKIPFIERVLKVVSLKEQVADFPPQPVITKDNVTMQIDTVLYFQITDPKLYAYGVEYPMNAIENLSATTLRNIIGDLELDQSLTSRDIINTKMRIILDEATDPWGIKVNRVELKNILPPKEIQNAMEKQMKAERERRESILRAEGEKASQILVAEGEKQSVILRADAAKQSKILEAEGQAEAIMKVQLALAESIKLLNAANPNEQVIKIKALEAFSAAADGKSTKIIIPSEIQGLAGLCASAKAMFEDDAPKTRKKPAAAEEEKNA